MQCDLVLHRVAQIVPGVLVKKVFFNIRVRSELLLLKVQQFVAEEIERLIAGIQKDRSRGQNRNLSHH